MPAAAAEHAPEAGAYPQFLIRLVQTANNAVVQLRTVPCRLQNFHLKDIYNDAGLLVFL
ncbi:hypothetical protein D3C87_2081500 [compost metagenome]